MPMRDRVNSVARICCIYLLYIHPLVRVPETGLISCLKLTFSSRFVNSGVGEDES